MTDEWFGYYGLNRIYQHQYVRHNEKKYVVGDCHTNTLEGFWSLLKRGVVGIYHSVSDKHIQKYVDEFVFRYNTRQLSGSNRFNLINKQSNGTTTSNRQVEGEQGVISF